MNLFFKICLVLVIVGGVNWGLIGLFGFDAVAWLCGGAQTLLHARSTRWSASAPCAPSRPCSWGPRVRRTDDFFRQCLPKSGRGVYSPAAFVV